MGANATPRRELLGANAAAPAPAAVTRPHSDLWTGLAVCLLCLLVYNANLRSISAGDTYPDRYLPFGILRYHTLLLDPISTITAQGRGASAYWIVRGRGGHALSLYPVVIPVILAPLYLPAVVYLRATGWDQQQMDRIAWIMEKLSASLLAATSSALLYLLLRRRAERHLALPLTFAYAFGTTTWVISSEALWQHGLGELLIVAAMLVLTGPCTAYRALAAGLLCGLIACNRPPDSILAVALLIYGFWWARRLTPVLVAAAAVPVSLVLIYNLGVAGNVAGGYGLRGKPAFFQHDLLSGLAGLLFSPTKGLFIFSPFLLFVPFRLRQAFRDRSARGITVAAGIAVVLELLLYAKADWRQGDSWGPRWLTDLLPVLLWMLPPIFTSLRRAGRIAFVVACIAAIAIEAIGAFWYTGASDRAIFAAGKPNAIGAVWDLRNAPFVAELRHAPAPAELAVDMRGAIDSMTTINGEVREVAAGKKIDVAGWALADGRSPWDVIVLIDGKPIASTRTFLGRLGVTKTPAVASLSGWRLTVPTYNLPSGEHDLAAVARAYPGGNPRFLDERPFTVVATPPAAPPRSETAPGTGPGGENADLALSARRAAALLTSRQQAPGYWLTSYTAETRFQRPRQEMNTFLTALLIDLLNPVAAETGLNDGVERARHFLAGQIEAGGLVRYHGRPDAPTIGVLGCVITPDADDTALVWRIAPSAQLGLLPAALATMRQYRTSEGLYRTWLAPQDRYQCINPGKDPNPADIGIQMHVFMLLAKADPPAAHALCRALGRSIADDGIWVYYQTAPLVPILRQTDLQQAGCALELPPARLRSPVPGQEVWVAAARMLRGFMGAGPAPASAEVLDLLRAFSRDDFSSLRQSPPLLYHNDLTASVRRFYWSEDVGYALWLRLYIETTHRRSATRRRGNIGLAACGGG